MCIPSGAGDRPPEPEPVSPVQHLEERKTAIYENLRDFNFEYRVGKLSDDDYQTTKQDLQRELAVVLAEIDKLSGAAESRTGRSRRSRRRLRGPASRTGAGRQPLCPHCKAEFEQPMKFCGECGKPMEEARA